MTLAYAAEPLVFWQQAVDLYRAEAAHIDDPHEAASLLVEAGEVLAEHLGQVDAAYAAFDAAQARAPDAVAPLLARARLAEGQADWTEATECLRAALGRLTGARRVPVLSTLSEICARNLGRPDEAVRLLQEAVTLAPDQRDLLIRLETARPGTEIAARREVLERRLAVTTSLAERGERLAELGGLLEANAPAKAARTFADAYAANPNWAPAVHGLIRTYVDLKRWDALGRALRTHAERITDDAVRAEVYAVCGVLADAHGNDPTRAVADLSNAQSVPGVAEDLVLARDRAGLATDDWWADATDPNQADRRAYHLAAAGRARLDGPLGAVIARRLALASGDDDRIEDAHAALTRHAVTDEDARVFHLAEGDEALWSTAPHEARAGYMAAVARQTDANRFPEGLIGLRAIARTTQDLDAWRRQVAAALTRTSDEVVGPAMQIWRATNDPAVTDADAWLAMAEREPGHFGAVDVALESISVGVDLSALVDAAVDAAQSPTRRVRLLLAGARRRAGRNDLEGACDRWRAVLAIDPLEVTARNALGRTLHHRAHTAGLAKLIETELAALSTDDARHQDAWLRYAQMRSANGEGPAALEMLRGQANPPWSSRLEMRRLADKLGDEAALKDVLDQPAAAAAEVRTDTLERAGVLLDLGELTGAVEAIDAVLTDAPADVLAAWVRAQVALAQGDGAHALRLTQQRLATARTPGLARINAHRLTAQLPLAEGRALMAERAAEDADAAWYMLCDAAAAADAHGVVLRLEQLAGLVGDRTAQAVLLEAGERAEALGLAPEDREGIWSRVVETTPGRATQMLLGLYAEAGDVAQQVATLTHVADHAERPAQAAVALWRAGLLLEDTHPQEASALYWQAIEAWPDEPVALLLALRVGDGGAPLEDADRAQQLEAIAARLVHDGRAARMLASAAAIRDAQGEEADARRSWLYAAMRYPEQDALASRALTLLADEDEARIALLEARVRRTTTTAAKAQARHHLAREYIDVRGDRAAAAEVFERIVEATPGDLDARQEYASLLVGLGRHADAVAQYRIAAQTSAEPTARVALYTRIGELLARHLNDLDGAIQALRQAIGLVDPTGRAQEVLAEVYLRAGEGGRALLAYQRLERMVGDSARRAQARAGQVRALLADGREDDARARLVGFLQADPFDPLLGTLARALDVEVPAIDEGPEDDAPITAGIDLAELDRLTAALDRTQSQQAEADDAVAQASAEAAAMLDLQAFDALEAALAQVTAARTAPPAAAAEASEAAEAGEVLAASAAPEADPQMVDVAATEPEVVDPEVVEPENVEPENVEPENAEPENAEPEVMDSPLSADTWGVLDDADADVPTRDDLAPMDDLVALEEPDVEAPEDLPSSLQALTDPTTIDVAAIEESLDAEPAALTIDADAEPAEHIDAADLVEAIAVIDSPEPAASSAVEVADIIEAADIADAVDVGAPDASVEQPTRIEADDAGEADVDIEPTAGQALANLPALFESIEAGARARAEIEDAPSEGTAPGFMIEPDASPIAAPLGTAPPAPDDVVNAPAEAQGEALPVEPLTSEIPAAFLGTDSPLVEDALMPPPLDGAESVDDDFDDFDDFEELSSVELEPWDLEEIDEVDDADEPVRPLTSAKPPPMPPALPPEVRASAPATPARPPAPPAPEVLKSTDAMAALREARSALGVPASPPTQPPPTPAPSATHSLSDLMARVDAVVEGDAPESAISASLLDGGLTAQSTADAGSAGADAPSMPPVPMAWPDDEAQPEAEVEAEASMEEAAMQEAAPAPALDGSPLEDAAPAFVAELEAVADAPVGQSPGIDLDAFDNALFDDREDGEGDDDDDDGDDEPTDTRSADGRWDDTPDPTAHVDVKEEPGPVASIDYTALPEGFFRAALEREVGQTDPAVEPPPGAPDEEREREAVEAVAVSAAPEVEPVVAADWQDPAPLLTDDDAVEPLNPELDSLDQAETGEMEALRVDPRQTSQAPLAWVPTADSAPPNPFSNLPATVVRPAEMALFEGEPTVVRFDELNVDDAAEDASADLGSVDLDAAHLDAAHLDAAEADEPEAEVPATDPPASSLVALVEATTAGREPIPPLFAPAQHVDAESAPAVAFDAAPDLDDPNLDDDDDFFGDAPDLLDSLIDAEPSPPERPSASITRTRRKRVTSGPSGSLSGYRRSSDTSAPPASLSIDRVVNAAALAASIARAEGDETSRPPQTLAAVALRRQTGANRLDPPAARARIATNPVDVDAWASLRIATSRGGSARWIADMRAWLDGRMHTGSVVGVPSRLPDALREGLRPPDAPLALIRMLRALRTRVPLGLAQAQRPDSLYSLGAHEPVTEVADRVAVALGCPMHDLMLDRAQPYALRVLADAVPVVCIGDALLPRVPEPGRSFLVGQGLAVLAEGTLPAEVLDEPSFLGFLAAVFDLLGLGGTIAADPARVATAAEWVQPVIDPHDETLKALALQVLASFEDVPASSAQRGLQTYTRRLALAVADGLGGALEVMRLLDLDERPLEGLSEADRQTFFAGNAAARDLVECAASAPCLAIRDWLLKNR